MGRIFYLIGKSSTGKDTILSAILKDESLKLCEVVQYTTRPRRDGETEGKEYHFISPEKAEELERDGKIVERRIYQTVHGPWQYMFVNDGQIDLSNENYACVGTLEAYQKVRDYFGTEVVVPIYIDVETGERLQRALNRERTHDNPKYAEMCRRFLSDEADFSMENIEKAGLLNEDGTIMNVFMNDSFDECLSKIVSMIKSYTETD